MTRINDRIPAARDLVAAFGVALPADVTEAAARVAGLRAAQRRSTITPVETLAAQALDALDLEEGVAAAVKTQATEKANAELLDAVVQEAARRASQILTAASGEIYDAVLNGPVLAEAFATLARLAPEAPNNLRYDPTVDVDGVDAVVLAATIRKTFGVYESAVMQLHVVLGYDPLGVGVSRGFDARAVRTLAGHAIAEVDYDVAQPWRVNKALRGVEGIDGSAWRRLDGYGGAGPVSLGSERHPAVRLAHEPGVTLSPAKTYDELEARVLAHARALAGAKSVTTASQRASGIVA